VEKYTRLGCGVLIKAYRTAAKAAGFSHRNWFRERSTLVDIKQEIPSELQTLRMMLDHEGLPMLSTIQGDRKR